MENFRCKSGHQHFTRREMEDCDKGRREEDDEQTSALGALGAVAAMESMMDSTPAPSFSDPSPSVDTGSSFGGFSGGDSGGGGGGGGSDTGGW